MSDNKPEVRNVTRAGAPLIKTWRERIGAAADFPLHVPSDVERAMQAEIDELRASWHVAGPLNGIPATFRHDEGAIARCSYCGRYSLDLAALGPDSKQPVCECGKQHGWSGSFVKPGLDARWSGKAPAVSQQTATSTPAAPADAREFVEALAGSMATYIDRETDEYCCAGCNCAEVYVGIDQPAEEVHKEDCIVLRARAWLTNPPASVVDPEARAAGQKGGA